MKKHVLSNKTDSLENMVTFRWKTEYQGRIVRAAGTRLSIFIYRTMIISFLHIWNNFLQWYYLLYVLENCASGKTVYCFGNMNYGRCFSIWWQSINSNCTLYHVILGSDFQMLCKVEFRIGGPQGPPNNFKKCFFISW